MSKPKKIKHNKNFDWIEVAHKTEAEYYDIKLRNGSGFLFVHERDIPLKRQQITKFGGKQVTRF